MRFADRNTTPGGGFGLLGVPTSAGTHHAGQDRAPRALRAAGLLERLAAHGVAVADFGDLPVQVHHPTEQIEGVRDLDRVARIAAATAHRVSEIRRRGLRPLVVGGDCTITLGVVAGVAEHDDVGLAYLDGDADLNVPEQSESGVLDTMGLTHLLGGGAPALSRMGPRYPLLTSRQVVLLGFDPAELSRGQWTRMACARLRAIPAADLAADAGGRAAEARAHLESSATSILVHFDVDVLDSGTFPLANYPHFGGLTLETVERVLACLCSSPRFGGLALTEVNPDHDPTGELARELVGVIARALATPIGDRPVGQ